MVVKKFCRYVCTATALSALVLACTPKTVGQTEQPDDKPIAYENLIFKQDSDYAVIPIGIDAGDRARWSDVSSSKRGSTIYNLIFYNKKNNQAHLLLDRKAIVRSFKFLDESNQENSNQETNEEKSASPQNRSILFHLVEKDTNGDEILNNQDAIVGYLSDWSGKNLKQITPSNAQFLTWQLDKSSNALFVEVLNDSDGDRKFTAQDETTFLRVNLEKPEMGEDIIGDNLRQKIQSILVQD